MAKRFRNTLRLSEILKDAAAPLFREKDSLAGRLFIEWAAVVGSDLAAKALPHKLSFPKNGAVLQLRVVPEYALEIQHMQNLILERIALYFGYPAVRKLRLMQMTGDDAPADEKPVAPVADDAKMKGLGSPMERSWIDGEAAERLNLALSKLAVGIQNSKR